MKKTKNIILVIAIVLTSGILSFVTKDNTKTIKNPKISVAFDKNILATAD